MQRQSSNSMQTNTTIDVPCDMSEEWGLSPLVPDFPLPIVQRSPNNYTFWSDANWNESVFFPNAKNTPVVENFADGLSPVSDSADFPPPPQITPFPAALSHTSFLSQHQPEEPFTLVNHPAFKFPVKVPFVWRDPAQAFGSTPDAVTPLSVPNLKLNMVSPNKISPFSMESLDAIAGHKRADSFLDKSDLGELSSLTPSTVGTDMEEEEVEAVNPDAVMIGKYTLRERNHKIQKYLQKRKQRSFRKKVRYVVRKEFADKRPRVKGRFVAIPKTTDSSDAHISLAHPSAQRPLRPNSTRFELHTKLNDLHSPLPKRPRFFSKATTPEFRADSFPPPADSPPRFPQQMFAQRLYSTTTPSVLFPSSPPCHSR